ncbi:MAG: signal peptidase I [Lachnospiraceae bacterium]|nr:signal peptidase I [Lachnospiraceae bacterium]
MSRKNGKSGNASLRKEILSISIYLLSVLILTYLLMTFVVQRTVVEGESMAPTFTDGDNVLIDKLSYRFHSPKRFDVIVFPYGYDQKTYYVKRIVGLPGETVTINSHGELFINDEPVKDPYLADIITEPGLAENSVYLKGDEYFVLGDNVNHSADSRDPSIGTVTKDEIVGKVNFRTYPFSKFGKIKKAEE